MTYDDAVTPTCLPDQCTQSMSRGGGAERGWEGLGGAGRGWEGLGGAERGWEGLGGAGRGWEGRGGAES